MSKCSVTKTKLAIQEQNNNHINITSMHMAISCHGICDIILSQAIYCLKPTAISTHDDPLHT